MSAETEVPAKPDVVVEKTVKAMPTCATCKFESDNRCHRYPPVIYDYHTISHYPMVKQHDFCGEHKKR